MVIRYGIDGGVIMSNSLFTDRITLYNHYKESKADKWKRTVLYGVQWTQKTKSALGGDGVLSHATETSITIPHRDGYVKPEVFIGAGWTLNDSTNLDVVVLGENKQEITEVFTIEDLSGAVTIKAASDNTLRSHLKTWKVKAV